MHKSFEELAENLRQAAEQIPNGSLYRHYKDPDSRYQVLGFTIMEADDSVCVRYRSLTAEEVEFTRPVVEWVEYVKEQPRYVRIED